MDLCPGGHGHGLPLTSSTGPTLSPEHGTSAGGGGQSHWEGWQSLLGRQVHHVLIHRTQPTSSQQQRAGPGHTGPKERASDRRWVGTTALPEPRASAPTAAAGGATLAPKAGL